IVDCGGTLTERVATFRRGLPALLIDDPAAAQEPQRRSWRYTFVTVSSLRLSIITRSNAWTQTMSSRWSPTALKFLSQNLVSGSNNCSSGVDFGASGTKYKLDESVSACA